MIVFYGTRPYGKVDRIPGLGHIATNFVYIQFIPIIPVGGVFVLEGKKDEGAPVVLRSKSMVMAWLRCALVVAIPILPILALSAGDGGLNVALALLGLFGAGGLLWLTYSDAVTLVRDFAQAEAIGREIGLNEEGRTILELQYGQISKDEAAERIGALRQAEAERWERAREQQAAKRERKARAKGKPAGKGATRNKELAAKAPRRRKRFA